ncbi:MAG: tetratricopeptide repeat protein [Saprospiraceae bacterium]|nr:tetratricopeptide repeat protein [Saprospiraceae bacterium]
MRNVQEAEKCCTSVRKAIPGKVLQRERTLTMPAAKNNLVVYLQGMGDYEKALSFALEFKAIREKVLGKKHPDYARA